MEVVYEAQFSSTDSGMLSLAFADYVIGKRSLAGQET